MTSTDEAAFEEFFRAQFPAVSRAAALITGDTQEGMDVAQEALARAYQHWRKVSRMNRPDAWVHKVASNLAVSRRRVRRQPAVPPAPPQADPDLPDDDILVAMRALPPAQRAVIALRFYLDWSVDDVADALDKRPGTVRALTHQGMERLRATLTKEPR